jgi:hypothetical protein
MSKVGEWTDLDKALDELEAKLTDVARGLTVKVWDLVLLRTPQFHGRMAASWTYSIGKPYYLDRSEYVTKEELQGPREDGRDIGLSAKYKGHRAAIDIANAENSYKDTAFKLGDTVYISNGVDHGEGPYSAAVENGEINLRARNQPGAPVRRTLDSIATNFSQISEQKGKTLTKLTLGRGNGRTDI